MQRKRYEPDARGVVRLPEKVTWGARVRGGTFTLRLRDGRAAPVTICGPEGLGRKLLATIDAALSSGEAGDDRPAENEAMLCLGRYGSPTRLQLKAGLALLLEPTDRRPPAAQSGPRSWYLHVKHAERLVSPFLVKLNAAGLAALAEELRSALEK